MKLIPGIFIRYLILLLVTLTEDHKYELMQHLSVVSLEFLPTLYTTSKDTFTFKISKKNKEQRREESWSLKNDPFTLK